MPNPPLPKTLWKLFVILMTSEYVNFLLLLLANVSFTVGVLCGGGRSVHQNKNVTISFLVCFSPSNVKEQWHSKDYKFSYLIVSHENTFYSLWSFLSEYKKKNQYSNDNGCRSNWCNNGHRNFILKLFSTWIGHTKPWVSFDTVVKDIKCIKGLQILTDKISKAMWKVSYNSSSPFLCKAWGSEPLRLFPRRFLSKYDYLSAFNFGKY